MIDLDAARAVVAAAPAALLVYPNESNFWPRTDPLRAALAAYDQAVKP